METKQLTEQALAGITGMLNNLNEAVFPEIMDINQAAAFTHYKKATIYSMVCQKKIPFKKKGNKLFFFKEDLRQWLLND